MPIRFQYPQRFEALQPLAAPSAPSADGWLFQQAQQSKPQARPQTQDAAPVYVLPKVDWLTQETPQPRVPRRTQPVEVPFVFRQAILNWSVPDVIPPRVPRRVQPDSSAFVYAPPVVILPRLEWL